MSIGRGDIVVHEARTGVPALIAFGHAGMVQDPLEFEHHELLKRIHRRGDRQFSRIYLNDPHGAGFDPGISKPPGSIEESVATLRVWLDELGPSEVITFGEGLGGHAVLVFGALLGALLGSLPSSHPRISSPTKPRFYHDLSAGSGSWPSSPNQRRRDSTMCPRFLKCTGFSGTATVLFGTRRRSDLADSVNLDVIHAQRLAVSPRVVLCPFPELGQGLLRAMIQGGDAERVLSSCSSTTTARRSRVLI